MRTTTLLARWERMLRSHGHEGRVDDDTLRRIARTTDVPVAQLRGARHVRNALAHPGGRGSRPDRAERRRAAATIAAATLRPRRGLRLAAAGAVLVAAGLAALVATGQLPGG